jgi:putative transposon-encoded protein
MTTYELQNKNSSAILEKIMELQQEIALINLHERAHVNRGDKGFEPSCSYCLASSGKLSTATVEAETEIKKISVTTELERSVELVGKAGSVIVPRNWAGKRVKVVLLDT